MAELLMIPFGPFRPDAAGVNTPVCIEAKNCLPGSSGFLPLESAVAATSALPERVHGAVSILNDDGSVQTYAGTGPKLYKLSPLAGWTDVSRLTGGNYGVGGGEQWQWAFFGDRLISTNIADSPQYIDVTTGTSFAALPGSPPKARYIDVVRNFVVLAALDGQEKRIQWSGNNNTEQWTPGTNESDFQDFPNGGPLRGFIGGEVGYVMQSSKITRMTYAPGSPLIFQFDEVEGGVGLAAPNSLVKLRNEAYFVARDGVRKMSLSGGKTVPVGVNKWQKWFLADIRTGSEINILSAYNPVRPVIVWSYIAKNTSGETPNRLLIYDWSIDEATFADVTAETLVQWLSPGVTLDTMDSYGNLDTLPFSLDSPFWRGGAAVMGLFGSGHTLQLMTGSNLAAQFVTSDGQKGGRVLVKGTRPTIDTSSVTVAIAARERDGDSIVYATAENMEDTGVVPAHASGNLVRARINVTAGSSWSVAQGIETIVGQRGRR